jgi:hypothetical protein
MSPTIEMPCRVDYRPVGTQAFVEWSGRVDLISASGCSIRTSQHPEPGSKLELRIYLPGSPWPIQVQQAEVIWSHWNEFTVEFLNLPIRDLDHLQRCLMDASALAEA